MVWVVRAGPSRPPRPIFNDDGWPDLYLANDYGPEELYLNHEGSVRAGAGGPSRTTPRAAWRSLSATSTTR